MPACDQQPDGTRPANESQTAQPPAEPGTPLFPPPRSGFVQHALERTAAGRHAVPPLSLRLSSFDNSVRLFRFLRWHRVMPKIFETDGYRFFFYSKDHRPIHVYVRHGGGEAVFEVEHLVELRESQGLQVPELVKAEEFATEHRELIVQKWHGHINR